MTNDGTETSVAAGATVNLFNGRASAFLGGQQPSTYHLFLTADAAGITASLVQNLGGTTMNPIPAGKSVNVASAAGAGPKIDEDDLGTYPAPPGVNSQLNVTNTTAGAVKVRFMNVIQP